MLDYLLICFISILSGKGILRLINVNICFSLSIFLAPIITLSFISIFLGWGILFNFPIKEFWYVGWIFIGIFSFLGLIDKNIINFIMNFFSGKNRINDTKYTTPFFFESNFIFNSIILWIIILLPVLTIKPYFSHGLSVYGGSNHADGWSYIAYGQYLWANIKGTEGQLIPLHQYGAHLSSTRFISSSILAFFSPLIGQAGDTQISANFLIAWSLFNLGSTCVFFAKTYKVDIYIPIFLFLLLFSRWILLMIGINNFDNAITLPFLPAFAGIAKVFQNQKLRWGIILGILTSACLYCYTEIAPIVFICAALLFIFPIGYEFKKKGLFEISLFFLSVFLSALLFSLPYLKQALFFMYMQFNGFKQQVTLLFPYQSWINIYSSIRETKPFYNYIGIILIALSGFGAYLLLRKKEMGLICCSIFLLLASIDMIYIRHNEYAGYKFLLLNWWIFVFFITIAIRKLFSYKLKFSVFLIIPVIFIFKGYFSSNWILLKDLDYGVSYKDIRSLRSLEKIKNIVKDKSILVSVEDPLENQWAVYFLRDYSIKLTEYRGLMAMSHVIPLMERSRKIDSASIGFELNNRSHAPNNKYKLVWTSGPYFLWRVPEKI